MKKLIRHIDNISTLSASEERINNILKEKGFTISDDLKNLDILVYKNSVYADQSKVTHLVINFGNLISEIHYYTKTE